jgi:hypothetical protein
MADRLYTSNESDEVLSALRFEVVVPQFSTGLEAMFADPIGLSAVLVSMNNDVLRASLIRSGPSALDLFLCDFWIDRPRNIFLYQL